MRYGYIGLLILLIVLTIINFSIFAVRDYNHIQNKDITNIESITLAGGTQDYLILYVTNGQSIWISSNLPVVGKKLIIVYKEK